MQSRTVAWLMAAMLMAPVAQAAAESPEHAITVSGEATLGVAPDLATINAGVTSRAKTAREASDANNKAMQKVLAALHEGGLADRDVRTEYLSLQPLREDVRNAPDRMPPRLGNRLVGQGSETIPIAPSASSRSAA